MKTEVTEDDLMKMISVGRKALLTTFVMVIIMFFHIMIDFFYHT